MRRAFATLSVAALAAGVLGGARAAAPKAGTTAKPANPCASKASKFARAQCESYTRSAPGDEYFGRMKLSYLGINNTFRDEAVRAGAYTTDPGLVSRVNFADEALRAWAAKYPADPQLSRSYFLGIQVLRKIYTQPAQDRAWQMMQILTKSFPSSYFGKAMARSLKVGFTEHYFAVPLPCPSPQPTLAPGARLRPTPTPPPTPEPSPTPTPAPNQPKVVVLIPPCVTVTPSPSPSPTPTGVPSALPSGAPFIIPSGASPVPSGPLTPQPTATPKTR